MFHKDNLDPAWYNPINKEISDDRSQPQAPPEGPQVSPMPELAPGAQSGQQQTAPPNGSSPATGPTQNKGYEAAGLQRLGSIIKMMTDVLPLVSATSDVGKELMTCMTKLSKFVPSGSVSPAADRNNIEQAAMRNTQNNQQMQAVQQMRQQGAGGGAPQMPGGQQAPRAA